MKTRHVLEVIESGLALALVFALLWVGVATAFSPLNKSLIYAARSGGLERVKVLLEKGAGVNAKDDIGRTALMFAARGGDVKLVGLLIQKGADLNAKDRFGSTALKLARNKEIKGLLRTFGAKE